MTAYFLDKPEQIKVSLTNICNYKCVMCFNPTLKQQRDIISDELLYSILDQCQELGVAKVSLGGTGEPTLHPRFVEYVQEAKRRGLWVSTTSNFSMMTKEKGREILEAGIDRVNISIFSSTFDEHWQYTKTDLFDQAVENVKWFIRTAGGQPDKRTQINVFFLPLKGINNYQRYVEFWGPFLHEHGLDCIPKREINWAGLVKMGSTDSLAVEVNFRGRREVVWQRKVRCPDIRTYLHILHDGSVLPCCNIPYSYGNNTIEFGNASTDRIIDIWKGTRYLAFKEQHSRMNSKFPFCNKCSEVYAARRVELSVAGAKDVLKSAINKISRSLP